MAKYRLKNKGRKVNCEILHESENSYVVKFNNGVVQKVPKGRVSELDHIDEGVLDTLKTLGSKIYGKGKEIAQKVKGFFVNIFNADNFVIFKSEDDKILSASHPVNAIEGAIITDSVNFVPSDDTVAMCEEAGIAPKAVENFEFSDDYTGAFDFAEAMEESTKESGSLIDALDENERLKDSEKINLHGTFEDWDEKRIVETLVNEYIDRHNGIEPKGLPLLIWGAPGIGKTAIIRSLKSTIKEATGESINILSVNGGSIGPDDFTLPATVRKLIGKGEDNIEEVKDLPKSWLPVYDANDIEHKDVLNAIANGAKKKDDGEYEENGPGGIFFIDEYSRMTQAGQDALMQTPTTREIGSSSALHFGDRWIIVCAANRPSDMARAMRSDALIFEGASKTRFEHCNFVPDPKDWLAWARKQSARRTGRQNILPEISSYIEDEYKKNPKSFGDFYEMYAHSSGELKGEKGTACPRTWEAFSEAITSRKLDNKFGDKYPDVVSIPKAEIVRIGAGIVGKDVAERFADFVSQFSIFTGKDAENVWLKGDKVTYDILKKQKLNSANIESTFNNHIFPMLTNNYPGGLDKGGVSPEAALNFIKFLEACCYEGGKFNLNRFKTISQNFAQKFGVDMRSVSGPYADAANYKEDVIAKNEIA